MGTNMENQKRKKVLVVGAGAAGEYHEVTERETSTNI
jgi:hypothetical protein